MSNASDQGCMTPPITDPGMDITPKRKNSSIRFSDTHSPQIDVNASDYASTSIEILAVDNENSPESTKKARKRPRSKISKDKVSKKSLISFPESDINSNAEISVGGPEDSRGLRDNSTGSSPVKSRNIQEEDPQKKKFSPFSEKKKTSLLRRALRLSAEEFIRIHVFLKKIPIINLISIFDIKIPEAFFNYNESDLLPILRAILNKSTRIRPRLVEYNTIDDCVELIKKSNKIIVLTGAGVSVSCGIPDFRSENGIYSRLDEFNLSDPQQMFCLNHFRQDPTCFYSFAKEIYPSNFTPSPSHKFIKLLEDRGKLLRNYTQNIDTLEQAAGITRVIQCHGSFATASCVRCHYTFPGEYVEKNIFDQTVPNCPLCEDGICDDVDELSPGVIKPDIVFFGEGLPEEYGERLKEDQANADLLIVMGTSLKVRPVSDIATILPAHVPSILINRTPNTSIDFEVQLLGFSDAIVAELCSRLNWELPSRRVNAAIPNEKEWASLCKPPYWHIFPGAQTEELLAEGLSFTPDCSSSSNGSELEMEKFHLTRKSHSLTPLLPTPPLASGLASREVSPRRSSSIISVGGPPAPMKPKRRKISAPPHHRPTLSLVSPRPRLRQTHLPGSSEEIDVEDSPVHSKTFV